MVWNISYLESVEDWLNALSKDCLKSIAKEMRLLELCGNQLKLPHSRSLGCGLFELRERRFGIRLYYCFQSAGAVIILHGGGKTGQDKDIKTARELLKKILR
jgi:putative addiction module killer protein